MKATISALVLAAAGLAIAADEITVSATLKTVNGYFTLDRAVTSLKVNQTAGAGSSYLVQSIQTNAAEVVTVAADVTTHGWAYLRNLTTTTTDYVDIGPVDTATNFLPIIRLYAGELALLPVHPTRALYAKAGTTSTNSVAGVNLEAWINER